MKIKFIIYILLVVVVQANSKLEVPVPCQSYACLFRMADQADQAPVIQVLLEIGVRGKPHSNL